MTAETHPISEIPLGALVAEHPARAGLFEELRLDYCCGGSQTLGEACAGRGLDLEAVRAALEALDAAAVAAGAGAGGGETTDWRRASIGELCDHIVAVHHDGLREAFPRIDGLLGTVVRVHGGREPRLHTVQRCFADIRRQLEPHLASEELGLFPACRAWEEAGTPVDERVLAEHEREHEAVGDALVALRSLCNDFDRGAAFCNTHRALLDELEAFERDLHEHVHEENNILLQRVRERPLAVPGTGSPEPLPACCERWLAEQAHGWAAERRRR